LKELCQVHINYSMNKLSIFYSTFDATEAQENTTKAVKTVCPDCNQYLSLKSSKTGLSSQTNSHLRDLFFGCECGDVLDRLKWDYAREWKHIKPLVIQ